MVAVLGMSLKVQDFEGESGIISMIRICSLKMRADGTFC